MKNKGKKFGAILLTGILCFSVFSGCLAKSQETIRPSDMVIPRMDRYEVPGLGLEVVVPEALLQRMDQKTVAMLLDMFCTEDGMSLSYGFLSWSTMTKEQVEAEVDAMGDGFEEWGNSLERIGTLGAYQADLVDQLDELTGCDQHQELGQTEDGAYRYYLSINSKADEELTSAITQIQATITEMETGDLDNAGEPEGDFGGEGASQSGTASVGAFTTQDVNGQTYTQDMFKDYELTMVNIFTTWCSPCVAEIPDLEKLRQNMADQGIKVNVVGVVLDVLNEKGEIDETALEKAKVLAEKTGATYPFLLPDESYMNGRLIGIQAVPETFFVDKDGNIVGETYSGSASLEDWTEVVEKELANLTEEQ